MACHDENGLRGCWNGQGALPMRECDISAFAQAFGAAELRVRSLSRPDYARRTGRPDRGADLSRMPEIFVTPQGYIRNLQSAT